MQLNKHLSIKNALTVATTVLLGTSIAQATDVESTLLVYSEKDRVSAAEGAVSVNHQIDEKQTIKIKVTFDALTGASPNGATPSNEIQTYTRPSGQGSYTIPKGEIPLDDTFKDTRGAVNAQYSKQLGRLHKLIFGANFSGEHDYTSLGFNAGISRDFNNKNTTVTFSLAFSADKINPEGGIPIPYASLAAVGEASPRLGPDDTKKVYDALLGITQTLDAKTLLRANYSRSQSSGYLTDPYKFFSIVEPEGAANPGEPTDFLYEKRPDKRYKNSVYTQLRRYMHNHALDLSYRYFWDDWGINSHTVNLFYTFDLQNGKSIEPHIRWYHQSEADFYIPVFIDDGSPQHEFTTADYRLSKFSAVTFGLQYAFPIQQGKTFKLMAEYYTQFGDSSPPGMVGSLLDYDLFPTLKAMMFRIGYNFSI